MIKRAIAGGVDTLRGPSAGIAPATRAEYEECGPNAQEQGLWHYLVTDAAGIRPRKDAIYTKECKTKGLRFNAGTVVEIDRRRRAGWTRWLSLSTGEGWLFDVSPKDRKVRMVEVEVQRGEWRYEVCAEHLPVLPRLQLNTPPASTVACEEELVTVVERVRPLARRGAFLRLAGLEGWVLDFLDGVQTLRRCGGVEEEGTCSVASSFLLPQDRPPDEALSSAQLGEWRYAVVDPQGVTLRSSPTYDKAAKLKARLEEGEIVTVVERRSGLNTLFLRVDSPGGLRGWCFDTQPLADMRVRMAEVSMDVGFWWYRIASDRGCSLRSRCSSSDTSKLPQVFGKGAVICVVRRAKIGDSTFLQLKDEMGWVFDRKESQTVVEGPITVQPMRAASATISTDENVFLRKAPTNESWAMTNRVLLNGGKVQVLSRTFIEQSAWMEVTKPGAMQGWVPADAVELDLDVSNAPAWAR